MNNLYDFKREVVWVFTRFSILVIVNIILFIAFKSGYMNQQFYGLAVKIWYLFYIFFGYLLFKRYAINKIAELIHKFLTIHFKGEVDSRGFKIIVLKYSKILEIVSIILAAMFGLSVFVNLSAFWNIFQSVFILVISFFIGLFTSSVLGNIIAYHAITQSNIISIGDRVRVGKIYGDITSMGPFFTNIKTIKNEVVSIPNMTITNNPLKNYSVHKEILIHIPVSLGYDVDKEKSKKLLISAAMRTKNILKTPEPFVLFLELGNYSVTYEINAYTTEPHGLVNTKSELIDNILDEFSKAKTEILSPEFTVFRQGKKHEK